MIGIILVAILAVLLIGIVLKILKLAIIVAGCVAIVWFAQDKLGTKRLK